MTASRIAADLSARAATPAPSAGQRDLCVMACVFGKDPQFWTWLEQLAAADGKPQWKATEAGAKAYILTRCFIGSRTELDTNAAAADHFHRRIRLPFLAWKEAQPSAPAPARGRAMSGVSVEGGHRRAAAEDKHG